MPADKLLTRRFLQNEVFIILHYLLLAAVHVEFIYRYLLYRIPVPDVEDSAKRGATSIVARVPVAHQK